jgi:hypothetical protein
MNSEKLDEKKTNGLNLSSQQFNQILERLAILDQWAKEFEEYKAKWEKDNVTSDSEKKNVEHVEKNDESEVQGDEESGDIYIESKCGDIEQRQNDQKATKVIVKFRRTIKPKRKRKSTSTIAKVSSASTCKAYSTRLHITPLRVFRRKKKYKWDDGG